MRRLARALPFVSDVDVEAMRAVKDDWVARSGLEPAPPVDLAAERGKIAARLRFRAAADEALIGRMQEDIARARALADDLESDAPPTLEEARAIEAALFRGRGL